MRRFNWHFIIGLLTIIFSLAACLSKSTEDNKVAKIMKDNNQEEEETKLEYWNIDAEGITENEVDSMVLVGFNQLYPTAKDANWSQDANEYLVSFMENNYYRKATFEEGGDWIQTVTDIAFIDLPIDAQIFITKKYKVKEYNHIIKVEIPEEVSYLSSFEMEKETIILTFDKAGKLEEKEIKG